MGSELPSAQEKPRYVASMFGRIAPRYDLMNTLMTGGMDVAWRDAVAEAAAVPAEGVALDVGTGTARLALAIARRSPGARVVGVDFAQPMLRAGLGPLRGSAEGGRVALAAADALRLPFGDEQFDAVVSAFVVRNLADVRAGVAEQARVLRPGGRLVVLEITPGPRSPLRPAFQLYFRRVVPLVGELVAGDPSAYTYLPESAVAFLEPERLGDELRRLGLREVRVRRLGFGSVAITSGRKG